MTASRLVYLLFKNQYIYSRCFYRLRQKQYIASHVLLLHQYDRIVPCHLVRKAHRACISITSAPGDTRTVQYQYVHSATLFMQYRLQTINQQLHAPRQQALLRLLRLRSTNIASSRRLMCSCSTVRNISQVLYGLIAC